MYLILDQIPERGRQISVTFTSEWAVKAVSNALGSPVDALTGEIDVSTKAGRVTVQGQLQASGICECERCGESFRLDLPVEVELRFDPAPAGSTETKEEDEEVEEEDLDIGWYHGNTLDLSDVVSEAVALALPIRLECPDVEACDERTRQLLEEKGRSGDSSHPGFAALRKLR